MGKNYKQDGYFTGEEISQKLAIGKGEIYELYNQRKIRFKLKKTPLLWEMRYILHFHLDDVREYLKRQA